MNLVEEAQPEEKGRIPRVSGDEPLPAQPFPFFCLYSPRERG